MSDKRKSRRVEYNKPVEFGLVRFGPPPDPPKHTGYVVDLSEEGIFIKTDHIFRKGIKLTIEIQDGGKCFKMQGTVTNSNKVPPALANKVKSGMGIHIAKPDPELVRIYRERLSS